MSMRDGVPPPRHHKPERRSLGRNTNIYLHYVLDLWFQRKWRNHEIGGDTIIVRYADDCVPRRHEEAEMI